MNECLAQCRLQQQSTHNEDFSVGAGVTGVTSEVGVSVG
jgi:hypothetical protein